MIATGRSSASARRLRRRSQWSQQPNHQHRMNHPVCYEPVEILGPPQAMADVITDVQSSLVAKQRPQINAHVFGECLFGGGIAKNVIQVLEQECAIAMRPQQRLPAQHEKLSQSILELRN